MEGVVWIKETNFYPQPQNVQIQWDKALTLSFFLTILPTWLEKDSNKRKSSLKTSCKVRKHGCFPSSYVGFFYWFFAQFIFPIKHRFSFSSKTRIGGKFNGLWPGRKRISDYFRRGSGEGRTAPDKWISVSEVKIRWLN